MAGTDRLNVFAYGSLIFEEVMRAVVGRSFENHAATLRDHERRSIEGASYPGLVEQAGGSVDGRVYLDVDETSVRILDRFEGEYYERRSVDVAAEQDEVFPAETYIFRTKWRHLLAEEEWDADRFERESLRSFLATYKGFSDLDTR